MRVTLNINDSIMTQVMEESGVKNKNEIINVSLDEYLRRIRRDKLKKLRGKINLNINLDEVRNMDFEE